MAIFTPDELNQFRQSVLPQQTQTKSPAATQKKGNLFTNLLPAIGGGLGAVAGIPLDIFGGAGSIAGGAAGSSLGEALKEHLLGQNLNAKQIGIQGLEGGALSAFQPLKLAKGASSVAKGVVNAGTKTAEQTATENTGKSFAKNLVTQGEQAQGRVAGVSAGSKVAGKQLTPQDTTAMLNTLKSEGINTGNANNVLRDIQTKLNQYGKQIGNHFTTNNAPLTATDTKSLAKNFLSTVKTTDPTVIKQATIVANDLKKNVTDTKSLWEFRKGLDNQIPDAKFGTDANSTAKVSALKNMRSFINDQLGNVPGSSNYHALSEVKPFVADEAKRLNNPGGGIFGRIAASGPVQKTEAALGKATEKVGQKLSGGAGSPPPDLPTTSRAANVLNTLKGTATLPVRAAASPLAYPGKSLLQVGKQATGRAVGDVLTATPQSQDSTSQPQPDLTSALMQAGQPPDTTQQTSQSPYSQDDLQYDIQRDPANAEKYISYYQNLDKIYNPASATTVNKPTAQQNGLAKSGYGSLQQLAQAIQNNPDILNKNTIPGQGLPLIGSLIQKGSGTTGYHALADNILQAIIHLQTGATATTSEVKAAQGQLPQAGNSQADIQQKLQTLLSDFQPFLGTGQ